MHPIIVTNVRSFLKDERDRFVFPAHAVYVGRAVKRYGLASSPLASPFKIGHTDARMQALNLPPITRLESIRLYRQWLRMLKCHPDMAPELRRLRALAEKGPLILVCHCAPLPCHANVIREVLMEMETP